MEQNAQVSKICQNKYQYLLLISEKNVEITKIEKYCASLV